MRSSPHAAVFLFLPHILRRKSMKSLWITHTPLPQGHLLALLYLLPNSSLEQLSLISCCITDEDVNIICQKLCKNTTIISLCLDENPGITSTSLPSFQKLLQENSSIRLSLEKTSLSINNIDVLKNMTYKA